MFEYCRERFKAGSLMVERFCEDGVSATVNREKMSVFESVPGHCNISNEAKGLYHRPILFAFTNQILARVA